MAAIVPVIEKRDTPTRRRNEERQDKPEEKRCRIHGGLFAGAKVIATAAFCNNQRDQTYCQKNRWYAENSKDLKHCHSFSLPRMALATICNIIPTEIQTNGNATISQAGNKAAAVGNP
ncbi:hypothetical protein [Phyllobacterium leguminum]|uniref:hypothetical protein n=1 Tax=Phyllobacterium leguminum TaxID=314237 RepID=UPI0011B588D1|nr:hypothetical protein [Phyllobacterium leguminum]